MLLLYTLYYIRDNLKILTLCQRTICNARHEKKINSLCQQIIYLVTHANSRIFFSGKTHHPTLL